MRSFARWCRTPSVAPEPARGRGARGRRRLRRWPRGWPPCASACWRRRYGPHAGGPQDAALAAEVRELARRLGGSLRGWAGRGVAAVPLALALWSAGLLAQAPPPEVLYERAPSGPPPKDSPNARRTSRPSRRTGTTSVRPITGWGRMDGRARRGCEASRLAPRSGSVAQALRLTPPPDATSARWSWTPPVTPEELLLLGALGWIAGWLGWTLRPRVRERWIILLVFSAGALLAGLALRSWLRRAARRGPRSHARSGCRPTGWRPALPPWNPAAPCASSAGPLVG